MNGLLLMSEAIAAQLNTHDQSMVDVAVAAVTLVPCYLSKREASLKQIHSDVEEYLIASLSQKPNAEAKAAQWSEKKEMDTAEMNTWTGQLNQVIENLKNSAELNEIDVEKIIMNQSPVNQCSRALDGLIAQGTLLG